MIAGVVQVRCHDRVASHHRDGQAIRRLGNDLGDLTVPLAWIDRHDPSPRRVQGRPEQQTAGGFDERVRLMNPVTRGIGSSIRLPPGSEIDQVDLAVVAGAALRGDDGVVAVCRHVYAARRSLSSWGLENERVGVLRFAEPVEIDAAKVLFVAVRHGPCLREAQVEESIADRVQATLANLTQCQAIRRSAPEWTFLIRIS